MSKELSEAAIASLSFKAVGWAVVIVLVLIGVAILTKHKLHLLQNFLFGGIVLTVLTTSTILIGSTILLNNNSSSHGPVHWHADFEVWACGQPLVANLPDGTRVDQLVNPRGRLNNKVGTNTLHEHNDFRIHLEGVVVKPLDASLGRFFEVIGGQISHNSLLLPTTEGPRRYSSGRRCGDSNGELQVFVIKTTADNFYVQEKLDDPADYIISAQSTIPTGDCIIIEFDRPKERTDKLCLSYRTALDERYKGKNRLQGELQ